MPITSQGGSSNDTRQIADSCSAAAAEPVNSIAAAADIPECRHADDGSQAAQAPRDPGKKDIEAEYQYIRDLQNEEREKQVVPRPLESEEKEALIQALKAKWEEVNAEYQLGAHLTKLDTVGKMRRKEQQEKMLTQLEKDIERIKKENVVIDPSM